MCLTEKCCFSVRLNLGCLWIGFISFSTSLLLFTASMAMLVVEGDKGYDQELKNNLHHLLGLVHLDVNHTSKELIMGIILFISIMWMMSSLALMFGVKSKRAGFVLCYFTYGIFITVVALLSSLLFLLQFCMIVAVGLFAVSLIHIHFLVVVNSYYELLLRGKVFPETEELDEQLLVG